MANDRDFTLELRAQELGLALKPLEKELEKQFQEAVANTINAAYAQIVAKAQRELGSLNQDYLSGLQLQKLGKNQYLIVLEGEFANKLEDGIPPHDMKASMLASKKTVEVGSRAGQPWVRTGAKGQKYASVPFAHNPFSKASPETQRLGTIIKGLTTQNRQGIEQKITQVFTDSYGRPLEGKVATIRDTGIKDLDNLVKYQKIHQNQKTGKQTVQSTYLTYRTVSENSPEGKWINPGRDGLKAFEEAERIIEEQLDQILKAFLG